MGLRSRLKSKVKQSLENIQILGKVIHDEAKHPGRPQPHMVARNPLWGGQDTPPSSSASMSVKDDLQMDSQKDSLKANSETVDNPEVQNAEESDFWFLSEAEDDWSQTNPGKNS